MSAFTSYRNNFYNVEPIKLKLKFKQDKLVLDYKKKIFTTLGVNLGNVLSFPDLIIVLPEKNAKIVNFGCYGSENKKWGAAQKLHFVHFPSKFNFFEKLTKIY